MRSDNPTTTPPRGRLTPVTSAAVFAWLALSATGSDAAYKCTVDGRTSYQDAPCTTGRSDTIKLIEPSDSDRLADLDRYRQQAREALRTCRSGSEQCRNAQLTLESIERLAKGHQTALPAARSRDLQIAISRTDAQVNYRRAKEEHQLAELAVDYQLPSAPFSAALARRSEASAALSAARNAYFKAFGKMPD